MRLAKSEARGLSRYERQGRREAPDRERRSVVSRFELLRRRTEGRDEFRVETVELLADLGAEGMEARSRRLLRVLGLGRRLLPQDGLAPERLFSTLGPLRCGRGFDRLNQPRDLTAVLLGRKILPTG